MVSGLFGLVAIASFLSYILMQFLHSIIGDRAEKTQDLWEEENMTNKEKVANWREEQRN